MTNKTKELYELIIDFNEYLDNKSTEVAKILLPLLQEESHAFGFKVFTDASLSLVNNVDKINNSSLFEYLSYEKYFRTSRDLIKEELLKEFTADKTKELLILLIDTIELLHKEEMKLGKIFSMFLSENQDSASLQSFHPLNETIEWLIKRLETEVFLEIHKNEIESGVYKDYLGFIYWYCFENNFGKKGLEINNIAIFDKDTFLELFLNLKDN